MTAVELPNVEGKIRVEELTGVFARGIVVAPSKGRKYGIPADQEKHEIIVQALYSFVLGVQC